MREYRVVSSYARAGGCVGCDLRRRRGFEPLGYHGVWPLHGVREVAVNSYVQQPCVVRCPLGVARQAARLLCRFARCVLRGLAVIQ